MLYLCVLKVYFMFIVYESMCFIYGLCKYVLYLLKHFFTFIVYEIGVIFMIYAIICYIYNLYNYVLYLWLIQVLVKCIVMQVSVKSSVYIDKFYTYYLQKLHSLFLQISFISIVYKSLYPEVIVMLLLIISYSL